jgi:protein-S-isoprenylcysteine O-methyltransferase Ste14
VAGLDHRYGWSAPGSPVVYIAGDLIVAGAFALLAWSMVVNRHFEGTVRIQEGRGHQVISSGPYRYVRHPGYAAVILTFMGTGLAVGSWAGLLVGALGSILFVVRTALEDRTLQAELPGYTEFARQTRYRLLPGVW